MYKTLAVTAIAMVAAILEIGTSIPVYAHDVTEESKNPSGMCLPFFTSFSIEPGEHPDHNYNGQICSLKIVVDERDRYWILDDYILFNL